MNLTTYPCLLAFDYGLKHIGVAFAQSPLAEPVATLKTFSQIKPLINRFQPERLIVGLPSGPLVPAVHNFAQRLKTNFHLPVVLHPETLSSQEAMIRLRQIKASRRKLKNDHPYAAALILEDYLESLS